MRKTCLIVVALALLVPSAVAAQEPTPPPVPWYVMDTFPADGATDAPINGVTAVRLGFGLESVWPDDEVIRETVFLRLTRGDDEEVEGAMTIARDVGEVRYVTSFPLAEGIEFTLHIELKNSIFGNVSADETFEVSFTTGDGLDEAAPAFSGLQSLGVTEHARAVQDCCPATEAYCAGQPFDDCEWCWTVDWSYLPQIDLTFRAVDDEFGADAVAYLVYRVDGPEAAPDGPPQVVRRYDGAGEEVLHLVVDDPGPWCYTMQAMDIWGRTDGNTTVLCGDVDDLVPIDRLEVPAEDRSNCQGEEGDPEPDVGVDMGTDTGGDVAVGNDTGTDAGTDAETQSPTAEAPKDSGCGCETPARSASWRWLLRR